MMGRQLANLIFAEVGNFKPPKMGNFTPPLTNSAEVFGKHGGRKDKRDDW